MALLGMTAALLFTAGAGAEPGPPPDSPPAAAPAKEPAALALVQKMCDRLKRARTFTVRARTTVEMPVVGGALGTFVNDARIAVRRPDGLAATRAGDLPEFRFVYDGKAMTVFVPSTQRWSTTDAPPNLDAMLVAAGEKGGLSFPFDALVVADPCTALTAGLTDAALLGAARVGRVKTDHVVLSSPALQVELWIDPVTSLLARAALIYVDHPARPHFAVEFTEWKGDPKLPASTFALPKPAGATEVPFRDAAAAFR